MLAELAADLVTRGWKVTVVTGGQAGLADREVVSGGVEVVRVSGLPFTKSSTWKRALAYISLYPAFLLRALRLPAHDVVITMTDPPFQYLLGPIIRWFKGGAAVHWAQDVYPELAERAGILRTGSLVARGFRRLSTWALGGHDQAITVGAGVRDWLHERGVSGVEISVVPNWPLCTVKPVAHEKNTFRKEHGLGDDDFVVMYSGNMGVVHSFEAIMDAATALNDSHPNVQFVFVGTGVKRGWLEEEVQKRNLSNTRFLPFQPKARLAESLSAADLHLVSMRQEMKGLVVPSKVYGVMAAGRPCLFVGPRDCEAGRLIREFECGTVLQRPSGSEVAQAIVDWKNDAEQRRWAGLRAQAAVCSARSSAVRAFEKTILQAMGDGERPAFTASEEERAVEPLYEAEAEMVA